jgi:hypothetical protein
MTKIRVTIEFLNSDSVKRKYQKEISAPDRKLERSMEPTSQRLKTASPFGAA